MSHSSAEAEFYALKPQSTPWRSSTSFRNSNQRFFPEMSRSSSEQNLQQDRRGFTSRHLKDQSILSSSMWFQDTLNGGVISLLEKVGIITIHQMCSRSFFELQFLVSILLGILNLFKDPRLPQVYNYWSGMEKIKAVMLVKGDVNSCAHEAVSKVYQQVCSQHQRQRFSHCQISTLDAILFRINKRFSLKDSEKHQFGSDAHSHQLRVEGAREIQTTQAFKVKITCSLKD